MTEIRFEDVQVGDRVRVRAYYLRGAIKTYEGKVTHLHPMVLGDSIWVTNTGAADSCTVELLDRPVPPAVCGDIREDPETGARYVRTDDSTDVTWLGFTRRRGARSLDYLDSRCVNDADIIARLRPVTP